MASPSDSPPVEADKELSALLLSFLALSGGSVLPKELDEIIADLLAWRDKPISVNRLEVIDHTEGLEYRNGARALIKWEDRPFKVELSMQDDNRTLKIFLSDGAKDE